MIGPFWVRITGPSCSLLGSVVHASEPPLRKHRRKTVDTLCGRQRAWRLAVPCSTADGSVTGALAVAWPPRVDEMREQGWRRCPDCLQLSPGRPHRMAPTR